MTRLFTELKSACDADDVSGIKTALAAMTEAQRANYLKYALLHMKDHTEIWKVLPHIDPNIAIYGGTLLGNTAAHSDLAENEVDNFRDGLGALIDHGANPNAHFYPAETGEEQRATDIFELAILSQTMQPTAYRSLDGLLNIMCHKGMRLEAHGDEKSKLQRLTEALNPSELLDKRRYKKRERVADAMVDQNVFSRPYISAGPIEGPRRQAKDLYDVLVKAGADPKAAFNTPDTNPENALNAAETLWSYYQMLEDLRHDPRTLEHVLSKHDQKGWDVPEFVVDYHTIENALHFYASLASHVQKMYESGVALPSDKANAAGHRASGRQ